MCSTSKPSSSLFSFFVDVVRFVVTVIRGKIAAFVSSIRTTRRGSVASAAEEDPTSSKLPSHSLDYILHECLREPGVVNHIRDPQTGALLAVMLSPEIFEELCERAGVQTRDIN